jgi:hypothetical protein
MDWVRDFLVPLLGEAVPEWSEEGDADRDLSSLWARFLVSGLMDSAVGAATPVKKEASNYMMVINDGLHSYSWYGACV